MPGSPPATPRGLHSIADAFDAIVCDIWGVLHDGVTVFPDAVEALTRFRQGHGPVVLLSNAPRRADTVHAQLAARGLPAAACHDAIVTSGEIARRYICHKHDGARLYHLGPASDADLTEGLPITRTDDIEDADGLLVSGPLGDDPTAHDALLQTAARRGLEMICANPDRYVMHGGQVMACAGLLAERFTDMGGHVLRTGKPEAIAFNSALEALTPFLATPPDPSRILVIGDGPETDIRGARQAGLPSLHIRSTLPGHPTAPPVTPDYAMDRLLW